MQRIFARREVARGTLKNSGRHPFSGSVGAVAIRTIHARDKLEIYDAARKSFARSDHMWFTNRVIFPAFS